MKSQLTELANELASRKEQPVLSYADPALKREDRDRRSDGTAGQGWRRLGFGLGLCLVLFGFAYAEWPSRAETHFCAAVGGFLFGAAIPSLQPRRTFDR